MTNSTSTVHAHPWTAVSSESAETTIHWDFLPRPQRERGR